MISKQEYRKYLLKQMADDKLRKQREKQDRMGVERVEGGKGESGSSSVQTHNHKYHLKPVQVDSVKPRAPERPSHLGITRQFDIQIASSSANESEDNTQERVYQKYPSKYETESYNSHNQGSELGRPISPRDTGAVMGRGRNLLAMENMDPQRMVEQQRKKSEMQRFLLQQMNQQIKNKTVEKRRRIEEERKLQQEVERYGGFEGEYQGRRRCKKMVTLEAYFPETASQKRSESEEEPTRKGSYKKTLSEEKQAVQGYLKSPKPESLKKSNGMNEYQEQNRFMTETREQFVHRPPIPSFKKVYARQEFTRKDSLDQIQQVSSPRRSNNPKSQSHYDPPSQPTKPPTTTNRQTNPGYNYRAYIESSSSQNLQSSSQNLQSSSKESEVHTVNEQKYDQIAWELKKVRQEILVQREMMAHSLAKINLDSQSAHPGTHFQSHYQQQPREHQVSPRHQSSRQSVKQVKPSKTSIYSQGQHPSPLNKQNFRAQQSELFCQSKKVPIMSKGDQQTLTMSRIDDFALGDNSIQRHIEQPSFMSKNQFIDPRQNRNQARNNREREVEPIDQYIISGDVHSERESAYSHQERQREKRFKRGTASPNYKIYYQSDS